MPKFNLFFPLDLFHEKAQVPLPQIERVEGQDVPEPYRQLLVHLSDMTPTLSAFHQEPIDLRVLGRHLEGEVLFREVVLHLRESAKPVEFGAIAIHLAAFLPAAREDILAGQIPLGTILATHEVVHVSCPQAFLRVESNSYINQALALTDERHVLYGRRNILATPEGNVIADILEILPDGP